MQTVQRMSMGAKSIIPETETGGTAAQLGLLGASERLLLVTNCSRHHERQTLLCLLLSLQLILLLLSIGNF